MISKTIHVGANISVDVFKLSQEAMSIDWVRCKIKEGTTYVNSIIRLTLLLLIVGKLSFIASKMPWSEVKALGWVLTVIPTSYSCNDNLLRLCDKMKAVSVVVMKKFH